MRAEEGENVLKVDRNAIRGHACSLFIYSDPFLWRKVLQLENGMILNGKKLGKSHSKVVISSVARINGMLVFLEHALS